MTSPRRRSSVRPAALLAALVAFGLVLSGCTSGGKPRGGAATTLASPSGSASSPGEQAAQPANARFYDQKPGWTSCGTDRRQCATVTVPVDWSAPSGATLSIALDRYPATDTAHRLGSLLFDPGGPGASGVDYVHETKGAVASPGVTARYDVVGLDPRGVGASSPVHCVSDSFFDTYLSEDDDHDTAAGRARQRQLDVQFAQGCATSTGALLGHLGTVDAARDLDVIRAALGDQRLNYLGVSYGTLLGATYAGMFPHRVGRFVLDGALDPTSTSDDIVMGQAKGLETSLRTYAQGCSQRKHCPLSHDTDTAVGQIRTLLTDDAKSPMRTGTSRPLTQPLAFTGVIYPLYSEQLWPYLDQALALALRGDGSGLLVLADSYDDRNADGTYASNLLEAFTAIQCLDYPADASLPHMQRDEVALESASPTFGEFFAYGDVQCSVWPYPPTRTPAPIHAKGAGPILVVGNTGDPITPYPWAQSLASQLSSGRLLTWNGQGHAAYRHGSTCVDAAVDGYLLGGVLPGKGATCTS